MRASWLISGLIALLSVSLSALIVLTKKPLCMDSNVVEKIDRVTVNGTLTAWQCRTNRWIPYDEKFHNLLPVLSSQTSQLEMFFAKSKAPLPVQLVWMESMEKTLRLQDHTVYLSEDLLLHSSSWPESLTRIWLRDLNPAAHLERSLMEGVLSDLVLHLTGEQGREQAKPEFQSNWMSSLVSARQACRQSELSTKLFFNCDGVDEIQDGVILGSVRPVVSQAMINAAKKLTLQQSVLIGQSLQELVNWLAANPRPRAWIAENEVLGSADAILNQVLALQESLIQFQPVNVESKKAWQQWTADWSQSLAAVGLQKAPTPNRWDHLVILGPEVLRSAQLGKILKHLNKSWKAAQKGQHSGASVAVQIDQDVYILPSETALPAKVLPPLRAHQLTWLGCEAAGPEKLQQLENSAERLLLVQTCTEIPQLAFSELFRSGYAGFAQDNPQAAFVEIYVPSLPKPWRQNPQSLLHEMQTNLHPRPGNTSGKFWQEPEFKRMGWQAPVWDEQMKAFRTKAVVDAIQAYR